MGVADKSNTLPHPYIVTNAHPVDWKPHVNLQSDWSLNELLEAKTTSMGVAMTKLHPLPHPHMVNNAHLVTLTPHAKCQPN